MKKKSEIISELDNNLEEMGKLISAQTFTVGDAQLFLRRYFNIRRKMEDLILSRDKWKEKYKKLINAGDEFE